MCCFQLVYSLWPDTPSAVALISRYKQANEQEKKETLQCKNLLNKKARTHIMNKHEQPVNKQKKMFKKVHKTKKETPNKKQKHKKTSLLFVHPKKIKPASPPATERSSSSRTSQATGPGSETMTQQTITLYIIL